MYYFVGNPPKDCTIIRKSSAFILIAVAQRRAPSDLVVIDIKEQQLLNLAANVSTFYTVFELRVQKEGVEFIYKYRDFRVYRNR